VKSIEAPGGDRVLAKAAEDAVYKWEVGEIAGRSDGVDRIPLSAGMKEERASIVNR
jgi:hypothetical protein